MHTVGVFDKEPASECFGSSITLFVAEGIKIFHRLKAEERMVSCFLHLRKMCENSGKPI